MERWIRRVAMVTGANSGIGAATAQKLVKAGLKVVGLGLTVENIQVAICNQPFKKIVYFTLYLICKRLI